MPKLTALETMKRELVKIQIAMNECITATGYVKASCRYRYTMLVHQAENFKEAIEQWQSLQFSEATQ